MEDRIRIDRDRQTAEIETIIVGHSLADVGWNAVFGIGLERTFAIGEESETAFCLIIYFSVRHILLLF